MLPTTMLVVAMAASGMIQGTAVEVDRLSTSTPLTETVVMVVVPLLQYVPPTISDAAKARPASTLLAAGGGDHASAFSRAAATARFSSMVPKLIRRWRGISQSRPRRV